MYGVNMNDRWHSYFMKVAVLTGELSYCKKRQVGAVAVKDKRIIATGYNGTLPGSKNICEEEMRYEDGSVVLKTLPDVEHAERNLIAFSAKHGIPLLDTTLYITTAPCVDCSKAIINSGINRVIYKDLYKNQDGIAFLTRHNILVERHYELV